MKDKKITNTDNNKNIEWLFGGNPAAIEAQEAQGQRELVESSQLPSRCNSPHGMDVATVYKEMGIKVVDDSEDDQLFVDVILPEGWKLESTDHSMWNKLMDDKGRERASIFYKAAFYDRDAFINFNHRYIVTAEYLEEEKEGDQIFYPKVYCVKDNGTGEILFKTDVTKEYEDSYLRKQAIKWLNKKYLKKENLTAYWD